MRAWVSSASLRGFGRPSFCLQGSCLLFPRGISKRRALCFRGGVLELLRRLGPGCGSLAGCFPSAEPARVPWFSRRGSDAWLALCFCGPSAFLPPRGRRRNPLRWPCPGFQSAAALFPSVPFALWALPVVAARSLASSLSLPLAFLWLSGGRPSAHRSSSGLFLELSSRFPSGPRHWPVCALEGWALRPFALPRAVDCLSGFFQLPRSVAGGSGTSLFPAGLRSLPFERAAVCLPWSLVELSCGACARWFLGFPLCFPLASVAPILFVG